MILASLDRDDHLLNLAMLAHIVSSGMVFLCLTTEKAGETIEFSACEMYNPLENKKLSVLVQCHQELGQMKT